MKRYACLTILSVFSGLVVFGASQNPRASNLSDVVLPQEHVDSERALIDTLDECIQQRFKDVDKQFGFRRIIRPGDTAHRFKPENAKELDVVGHLSRHKLDVVLYLAGRGVLAKNLTPNEVENLAGKLIKGPVRVTSGDENGDEKFASLPTFKQLLDKGREAMQVFQWAENYGFNLGEWKFIARPVRASDKSCLQCHHGGEAWYLATLNRRPSGTESDSKPLQIGDPLGLLVYGFRSSEK